MTFQKIITRAIKDRKLNKSQAAKICGLTDQQFGQYVLGKRTPSFNKGIEMLENLKYRIVPTYIEEIK